MKKKKEIINAIKRGDVKKLVSGADIDKVVSKIELDKGMNAIVNTVSKQMGVATADDYRKKFKNKKIGIVKHKVPSLSSIAAFATEQRIMNDEHLGLKLVSDVNGNIIYKMESKTTFTDRDIFVLYDADDKKVGYVKQWIMSVGIPLFERRVKMCSVYLEDKKICDFRKSELLGDLYIDTVEGSLHLSVNKTQNVSIKYKNKNIAKLYAVPVNIKDGYVEEYIIEFIDEEKEGLSILAMLAFETFDILLDIYNPKG